MTRYILIATLAIAQTLAQPVRTAPRHVSRVVPGCGDPKAGCSSATLDYVEVMSGPAQARGRINAAILAYLAEDKKFTPVQYANDLNKQYQPVSDGQQWDVIENVGVPRAAPPVFGVECYREGYVGGAHPIHETKDLNFDSATGDPVKLTLILEDGSMPALTVNAEKYFRKEKELGPNDDLSGFAFPHGHFELNDNYGIGDKSLLFCFNEYEIDSSMAGPTRLDIPYSEIRDLLRPDFSARAK